LDSLRLKNDIDLKIEELKKKLEDLNKTSINTLELNKIRNYPKFRNFYILDLLLLMYNLKKEEN